MNVEVKKLAPDDVKLFTELIDLFREVLETDMETKAQPEHLQRLLAKPDFIVIVARFANRVVGGLTAHVLPQYHSEKPVGYLYDMAVGATYQGRGIGTKLLTQLKHYCRSQGAEELFVQADREDSQAIHFYRATGGAPMQAVHFTYALNE